MNFSWIKRATKEEKEEMQIVANCHNELAHESLDTTGIIGQFQVVRQGNAWVLEVKYSDGGHDAASFVRCGFCGAVRELFDGQIEFCTSCWKDW